MNERIYQCLVCRAELMRVQRYPALRELRIQCRECGNYNYMDGEEAMIEYEARTPRQVVQELDENIDRLMEQVRRLERVVLLSLKMHEADGFYPPSDIMETIRAMKERHPDV